MASRLNRGITYGLTAVALAGAGGSFVFGVLSGEGGKGHVRNIFLGVMCAVIPLAVSGAGRLRSNRLVRAEIEGREQAIADRQRALESKQAAEEEAAEVRIEAEAQLIFDLRARLSSILYCLGKIAARPPEEQLGELVGVLTHAVVAAAVVYRGSAPARRSIFFRIYDGRMECADYAGPEGLVEAPRTAFMRNSDNPLGSYMFRLLDEGRAVLVPDVGGPDVPVRFPHDRSYQTAIAAAVGAGDIAYGILTLDAPEAGSLGPSDLEIIKTLASLLGVGLALASSTPARPINVPSRVMNQ